jgi:hypothetical protein
MAERNVQKGLLPPKDREIDDRDLTLLHHFLEICLISDVSFELSFDTARWVEGVNLIKDGRMKSDDEITYSDITQGQQGFRVTVANQTLTDDEGNEVLYPSLEEALMKSLNIAYFEIIDKDGEAAANKIFKNYFPNFLPL